MKYLHHYKCYKVFHASKLALTRSAFTTMSAIKYFMRLSMLLHVLIENEQHDQQRLENNYWQNNVMKNIILQYFNNIITVVLVGRDHAIPLPL
jgi:hypothetical protein